MKAEMERWLVVSATGQGIVNLVPAVMIGLENFTHVVVLKGLTGKGAVGTDNTEAEFPARRFKQSIALERQRRQLDSNPLEFVEDIVADKDTSLEWTEKVRAHFEGRKKHAKLHITYVYTGGTRDMLLGTEAALRDLNSAGAEVVRVSKQSHRLFYPDAPHKSLSLRGNPTRNRVTLDGYLKLYGFRVRPTSNTARNADSARDRKKATQDLFRLIYVNRGNDRANELVAFLKRFEWMNGVMVSDNLVSPRGSHGMH